MNALPSRPQPQLPHRRPGGSAPSARPGPTRGRKQVRSASGCRKTRREPGPRTSGVGRDFLVLNGSSPGGPRQRKPPASGQFRVLVALGSCGGSQIPLPRARSGRALSAHRPTVQQNPLYNLERCKVFQCDLTKDDLLDHVPRESVDIVMLIFVLSAVHPDKMHLVLQNIYKVLKPGKSVLFRDYGLYDHTMLRFKASSKLGENFYVRQDGTRSYFFTEEFLAQLFVGTGYEEVVNEYVFRETVNKKEGLCVPRVFLQSKFRKPPRDLSPATLYHQGSNSGPCTCAAGSETTELNPWPWVCTTWNPPKPGPALTCDITQPVWVTRASEPLHSHGQTERLLGTMLHNFGEKPFG
ncbi:methyltransferase-like protein 6 isoform X11 [Heterocephalus glaber]|uniref:Methyltransferase-like protein 6 isoform X11 n=1 Tax=Heterocephalus glaber TaxID=10181 RepID=A0AAX6RT22_HETGA|nr:methyltransferase-like protein 6 isoform X11 [Heterocephalus glaber]